MRVDIDTSDLMRFVQRLEQWPARLAQAQVEALNEAGDATRREAVYMLSDQTQFPVHTVERYVVAKPATLSDPTYEIKFRAALLEDDMSRQMPTRGFEQRERGVFEAMLVNVVTAGDHRVCPICEAIAAEGPYDIEEVRSLQARHVHFLNRDLDCRCQLAPARFTRRLPVRTREGRGPVVDMQMTLRQLAEKVLEKSKLVLRAK